MPDLTYEVLVDGAFTASHAIRLPDGTVETDHAHDWQVTVRLAGGPLDSCGLLVDFDVVKADLAEVLSRFDGSDLNRNPIMRGMNPTAERVAQVILESLLRRREGDVRLREVRVTEAAGCVAVCRRKSAG